LELGDVVFVEEEKPENPDKNSGGKTRTINKLTCGIGPELNLDHLGLCPPCSARNIVEY